MSPSDALRTVLTALSYLIVIGRIVLNFFNCGKYSEPEIYYFNIVEIQRMHIKTPLNLCPCLFLYFPENTDLLPSHYVDYKQIKR